MKSNDIKQKPNKTKKVRSTKTRTTRINGDNKYTSDSKTIDNPSGMTKKCKYDEIKSNDISWYNKASFLFDEAVRVPFDAIAGAPRSYGTNPNGLDARSVAYLDSTTPTTVDGVAMPGIMAIEYYPTIGYADGVNSPVNRAFTTMYGDIASKTTGAMQFQQADLAFFNTSLASAAAIIGCAKRALEVATLYSPMNYYYPVDLLSVLLGTQEDAMHVIGDRDLYRARINDLIYQFNSLKIPAFVSIFERQYGIAHNVYADEDSVQAQLYVFRPLGFYEYSDTDVTMKMIKLSDVEGEYFIDKLITAAQRAMAAWRNSSAFPLISGALQRAYPDNEFISLDMLTVDSVNVPVCDRNILWQINNSRSTRVIPESLNVTQDVVNDFLICKPKVDLSNVTYKKDFWRSWVYLNSYDHNESAEFIMEATRLIPALYADSEGVIKTGSTELITTYRIYFRVREANGNSRLAELSFLSNLIITDPVNQDLFVGAITHVSKWKNAPRIDLWKGDDAYYGILGDLADYTYLYPAQLESLHEAALQSLFWIGSMNLRV